MTDVIPYESQELQAVSLFDKYIGQRRTEHSKRTMSQALVRAACVAVGVEPHEDRKVNEALARAFRWENLRANEIEAIQARLSETVSLATANVTLAAIRGMMRVARRERLIELEDLRDIEEIKPLPESNKPLRGRALSDEDLTALALVCRADKTIAGRRDAALMAVAYGAGLRRFEIAGLIMSDWNAEESSLLVRRGKGRKDRVVYLSTSGANTLGRWLDLRRAPSTDSAIFTPINKGGRIADRGMSAQAIYDAFHKRALGAGIERFSPHDMRRSFISDLLDGNNDISTIAQLAGHANASTTIRYDRRGERAKKAAAAKLRVTF